MTSTPERGFEAPFCQLLVAEGHSIVHINSHSAQEDGKDVLSIDSNGELCGFQLKSGNIDVGRWRDEVEPELRELAEFPVHHPNYRGRYCRGALVTTGSLSEPALHKLAMLNESIRTRAVGHEVGLVTRDSLLDRFLKCQHAVLPVEPMDFRAFLQLVLADGEECLDRELFTQVLDNALPDPNGAVRSGEARRLVAGALILASHALASYTKSLNHLAVAEGWTLAAAGAARAALSMGLRETEWKGSFDLAVAAAVQSLQDLEREALESPYTIGGTPLGDGGLVWRVRATMVAGAVAANCVIQRVLMSERRDESRQLALIEKLRPHFLLWGESAIPLFLAIYWCRRRYAKYSVSEETYMALSVIRSLAGANRERRPTGGVPSPYYSATECLQRLIDGEGDDSEAEAFGGAAYTVLPMVAILVERLRRQTLQMIWPDVVELSHTWIDALQADDFLRYKARAGVHRNYFFARPTSWSKLRREVEDRADSAATRLPGVFTSNRVFAILFILVCPQRINMDTVLWLDRHL